jgi:TRAP-type mannitol/chloroaromatic compound transport system substrate-binding protein
VGRRRTAGLLHQQGGLQRLSAENKAIVECASANAHTTMQAMYDARNPAALKRLVAGGAKVLPFPRAVMDEAFKQSMGLYEELNSKNPTGRRSTPTTPTSAATRTSGSASPKPV